MIEDILYKTIVKGKGKIKWEGREYIYNFAAPFNFPITTSGANFAMTSGL
jgi:hypothetical protein